jgi:REP-associated tyrosine transposase
MTDYRRTFLPGGTFFFTLVTFNREPWLCHSDVRRALRDAISKVRAKHPFSVDAWVLLPDHLHCMWTLPGGNADYSVRWRLIKTHVTKKAASRLPSVPPSASGMKRGEGNLWQRRFWEHRIRGDADFRAHCDYIHYNPAKHGLCNSPRDWEYSTFRSYVHRGIYPADWGEGEEPNLSSEVGSE